MARARQANLGEFENGELPPPPLVILDTHATTVNPPNSGKIAGHIGVDKHRGGRSYISRKEPGKHLYRKGGGYALSKKILGFLMRERVHTLYWFEETDRTTFEFGIKQYVEDARSVQHAPKGDPQVYLPNEDARHIWFDHTPVLDARNLSRP